VPVPTARQRVRDLALTSLRPAGALLARTPWRRRRLLILCYHGVSLADEHEWNPAMFVSPARLEARLARLRALGATVLPLGEALERLWDGTLPPRAVALTFDDGTVDFLHVATPILRRHGAPATVYVATAYAGAGVPVFTSALGYVLWRARATSADVRAFAGEAAPLPIDTPAARERAAQSILRFAYAQRLDIAARHRLLEALGDAVGVDVPALTATGRLQVMGPDQVRALPRDLVSVQLHTHHHVMPPDAARFDEQVAANRAALAGMGESPEALEHFCYPSGRYHAVALDRLPFLGVQSATTTVPGLAARDTDPLLLPRVVDTMHVTDALFTAWVEGTAAFLPRRARYRFAPDVVRRPSGPVPAMTAAE
jgi:peptidoglycan/xylan/chitin deacetylase (PgdA/CDA1 family)